MKRTARWLGASVIAAVLLGGLASWVVAGRLIEAAPRVIGGPPAGLPANAFTVATASGETIVGWHVRAAPSRGVIVLLHPIRTSRLAMVERARWLSDLGYSSVLIDLSGHGESSGETIMFGAREAHDARAAVDFARTQHPGEPIGVIGVSLGGAAAILAGPLDIDALVVESVYPFIDEAVRNRVAARLGGWSRPLAELLLVQLEPRLGITREVLRPIDHIHEVDCPVLVIGGADDEHTTAAETRALAAAADLPREVMLIEGAVHEDLERAGGEVYRRAVGDWLERWMTPTARRPSSTSTSSGG